MRLNKKELCPYCVVVPPHPRRIVGTLSHIIYTTKYFNPFPTQRCTVTVFNAPELCCTSHHSMPMSISKEAMDELKLSFYRYCDGNKLRMTKVRRNLRYNYISVPYGIVELWFRGRIDNDELMEQMLENKCVQYFGLLYPDLIVNKGNQREELGGTVSGGGTN